MRGKEGKRGASKRAQLTLLIILGIVIVAGIIFYFVFADSLFESSVPRNMKPVYDAYTSCLEDISRDGVYLLGSQGGYIKTPDFEPGSSYRPFSNQLDFFGQGVPYWFYVSGNNILKEQVPTKEDMAKELETYLEERLDLCNFLEYEAQGFGVLIEEGAVDVKIKDNDVEFIAKNSVTIYFGEESARVNEHTIEVDVRLGKIYDQAKELYNFHKTELFLEKYAIDVLRLHAPVDGVELTCTPLVFEDTEIKRNITQGLAANINFIKTKGSYYKLSDEAHEYFVADPGFSVDTNVNFLFDPNWPTRIEIHGERVAKPVGLQEGLSILGFCYAPYHLVYDVNFPVMIQFFEDDFFFQFPVAVLIEKNQARDPLPPLPGYEANLDSEVCKFRNQQMTVYTYDSLLNPVPARLQFKCLSAQCEIGNSLLASGDSAVFRGNVPQCLNGQIIASAPGFADTTYQISTNENTIADIILKRKYTRRLDLGNIDGTAVITFVGEDYSTTVLYPENEEVELVEDYYNITVHTYKDSTITLEGYENQKCVDTPVDGIGSLFGLTEEKCFDLNVPDMQVETALSGGGQTQDFITEDTLRRNQEININVPKFYEPRTIEDLQANYVLLEDSTIYISFE